MMRAELSRAVRIAALLACAITLLLMLTACGGGSDDGSDGPPDLRGINPPNCAACAVCG